VAAAIAVRSPSSEVMTRSPWGYRPSLLLPFIASQMACCRGRPAGHGRSLGEPGGGRRSRRGADRRAAGAPITRSVAGIPSSCCQSTSRIAAGLRAAAGDWRSRSATAGVGATRRHQRFARGAVTEPGTGTHSLRNPVAVAQSRRTSSRQIRAGASAHFCHWQPFTCSGIGLAGSPDHHRPPGRPAGVPR